MSSATRSPAADNSGAPDALVAELMQHPPFTQMQGEHLQYFIDQAQTAHYSAGTAILSPSAEVPAHLLLVRKGHVTRQARAEAEGGIEYEAGDLFPIGTVMAGRPVDGRYDAHDDVDCLLLPLAQVRELCRISPPFAEFMQGRVRAQLQLSRQAMQASMAAQSLAEQSLEARLGDLALKTPISVAPETPLAQALATMHERKIGSMLVLDAKGAALGILTRHDMLDRVVLARVPLETPIAQVMTSPILTLTVQDTAQDAALLMSRHTIRHVPVTRDGAVVGMVSERDLFAMQRMSIHHVSSAIRSAKDEAALVASAQQIRAFSRHLIVQGVAARQLTQLISHLNDLLTECLVLMKAQVHGVDMQQACWLAFGSEGRSEQTISTDQDNGLIFLSDDAQQDRARWLTFARDVNEALDRCGYPLCKGNIMASNPDCCLTPKEWSARFDRWMEHGAPQDLLNANIYFDRHRDGGRSRDGRSQAPRYRRVCRRLAHLCVGPGRGANRHARAHRGHRTLAAYEQPGQRSLDCRVRVLADVAPAGADERHATSASQPGRVRWTQPYRPAYPQGKLSHGAPPSEQDRTRLSVVTPIFSGPTTRRAPAGLRKWPGTPTFFATP